jgi:hypothetical protein
MPAIASADVLIAIRTLAALIFLGAAAGKMRHWQAFEGVVANYRLLPRALIPAVAYALPPVEAVIGASLLIGAASPWAPLGAAALLGVFALAMAVNLLRGRSHIDCGCFQTALKQKLRWPLVARNVVLMPLVGFSGILRAAPAAGMDVLNGLMAGGALFLVLQSLNALWAVDIQLRKQGAS